MRRFTPLATMAALGAALLFAGCASVDTHATFVTKTSVALLDVDSAPSGVSFGYQRTEGYLGPRLKDGSAVPVAGFVRTNGDLLGRSLQQVYATGCAAEIVSGAAPAQSRAASACAVQARDEAPRPMLFATGTTLGVGFSLGEGNAPSLTLGYRRKEASVIPVDPGAMPSVLATHGNVVQTGAAAPRVQGEIGITQYFATGRAADALAAKPEVGELFRQQADDAIGAFRQQERMQSQHALTALGCIAALRDEQLPAAWANARALGLLPAAAAGNERAAHARVMAIGNADSAETTTLLALHRRFVCDLAKP